MPEWKVSGAWGLGLAVGAVLAAAGAGAEWMHRRTELATPASVLAAWTGALREADAPRAGTLTSAEVHDALMRDLCAPRYRRAKHVYDEVIPRLARPAWEDIRRRAEGLAIVEALRLRTVIDTEGRQAVGRAAPEHVQVLVTRPALFEQFIVCNGYAALPAEDREKIADPMAFWRAVARLSAWTGAGPLGDRFIVRAAWSLLPAEDRTALGTPEALSESDGPEKLACFDRIGKPLLAPRYADVPAVPGFAEPGDWILTNCTVSFEVPPPVPETPARREQVSPDMRPEIEGIERADVDDLPTFIARHGERVSREVLKAAALGPAALPIREQHPLLLQGSLLRRTEAGASTSVAVRGSDLALRAAEVRVNGTWSITSASPAFVGALTEDRP